MLAGPCKHFPGAKPVSRNVNFDGRVLYAGCGMQLAQAPRAAVPGALAVLPPNKQASATNFKSLIKRKDVSFSTERSMLLPRVKSWCSPCDRTPS